MLSVLSGHTDCVYSLLSKGANVEAKDKWGRTALHRGVRTDHYCYINSFFILGVNVHYGTVRVTNIKLWCSNSVSC